MMLAAVTVVAIVVAVVAAVATVRGDRRSRAEVQRQTQYLLDEMRIADARYRTFGGGRNE